MEKLKTYGINFSEIEKNLKPVKKKTLRPIYLSLSEYKNLLGKKYSHENVKIIEDYISTWLMYHKIFTIDNEIFRFEWEPQGIDIARCDIESDYIGRDESVNDIRKRYNDGYFSFHASILYKDYGILYIEYNYTFDFDFGDTKVYFDMNDNAIGSLYIININSDGLDGLDNQDKMWEILKKKFLELLKEYCNDYVDVNKMKFKGYDDVSDDE